MKRKAVWLLLVMLAMVLPAVPARAADPIGVKIDGVSLSFDVQPRRENDRVLVPLRTIFEALGATITWNGERQEVKATSAAGVEIYLRVDHRVALVNGQVVLLDVPARLVDSRTLVPVRFVAESLGATVGWDDATQTVLITRAAAGQAPPAINTRAPGDLEDLLKRAFPATVLILADGPKGLALGSGFFLNDKGLVATNFHVLDGATQISVFTYDKKEYGATRLVVSNKARDVLVMETEAVGYPALPLGLEAQPGPGHGVLAVGNPQGLDWTVSEGIIGGAERIADGVAWLQHSAPISKGSSGGPLVSRTTGVVLGMNTFMLAGDGVQNLNFASTAANIAQTLEERKTDLVPLWTGKVVRRPGTDAGTGSGSGTAPAPAPVQPPAPPKPPAPIEPEVPNPPDPLPDVPAVPVSSTWLTPNGDVQSRGAVDASPGTNLKAGWATKGIYDGQSLLVGDRLYHAEAISNGTVFAMDATTGSVLWKQQTGSEVYTLAATSDMVFVGGYQQLIAYSADGTRKWRVAKQATGLLYLPGKLYVQGYDGTLSVLDPATGQEVWSVLIGAPGPVPDTRDKQGLTLWNDRIFVPFRETIVAVSATDGSFLFSIPIRAGRSPVVDNGLIYITWDRLLLAYNGQTGRLQWKANLGTYAGSTPVAANGTVVTWGLDNYLYAFDGKTGKPLWEVESNHGLLGGRWLAIGGNDLFVAGGMGIGVFNLQTGARTTVLLPASQTRLRPIPTANALYVGLDQWSGIQQLIKK